MKPSEKLWLATKTNFIPLMCVFELTQRCNLKCQHCYIDAPNNPRNELTTKEVKSILSQLARAGSLNLVFTGGEIFLRKDILELCRFARQKGFELRLFTNGTLIDTKTAKYLASIGVSGVDISLYGGETTHENITGVKGSFSRSIETINILIKQKVRANIKCPVMKTNFNDYNWLIAFAKKLKINYNFDPTISPRNSGSKVNLKYRLSDRQLNKLLSDPVLFRKPEPSSGTPDLSCSAGVNALTIGFDGKVYPCLQYFETLGNLKKQKLKDIWTKNNKHLMNVRGITIDKLTKCKKCQLAQICGRCPGIALLEDKTLTGPSKIACKIAKIENSLILKN